MTQSTPEQKRRLLLKPEPVFTASQAGVEVQRRFLLFQRLFFTLAVLVGLGSMWGMRYLPPTFYSIAPWVAFGEAAICFTITLVMRGRTQTAFQALFFLMGWLGLGAGVGCALGASDFMAFANVTILLGVTLVGGLLNTAITRRRTPAPSREFLLTGPWLLVGCLVAFIFFPAGEWALLVSGLAALALLFFIHQAALESLERYTPAESLIAATDVVPIALLSTWRRVSGEA